VGLTVAAIRLLYLLTHFEAHVSHAGECGPQVLRLSGAATFVRLPQLATVLERLSGKGHLRLDLAGLHFVDHACQQLLSDWHRQQTTAGRSVVVDRRSSVNSTASEVAFA
jgi:ABC-type transporter Mla MlaB component